MRARSWVRRVAVAAICVWLAGCSAIETAELAVGVRDARARALNDAVGKFHHEMSLGSIPDAAELVSPEFRLEFPRRFGMGDDSRFVDLTVEKVEFPEKSSDPATVDITVKMFKIPVYIVEKHRQREKWEFRNVSAGWVLVDVSDLSEEGRAAH